MTTCKYCNGTGQEMDENMRAITDILTQGKRAMYSSVRVDPNYTHGINADYTVDIYKKTGKNGNDIISSTETFALMKLGFYLTVVNPSYLYLKKLS